MHLFTDSIVKYVCDLQSSNLILFSFFSFFMYCIHCVRAEKGETSERARIQVSGEYLLAIAEVFSCFIYSKNGFFFFCLNSFVYTLGDTVCSSIGT